MTKVTQWMTGMWGRWTITLFLTACLFLMLHMGGSWQKAGAWMFFGSFVGWIWLASWLISKQATEMLKWAQQTRDLTGVADATSLLAKKNADTLDLTIKLSTGAAQGVANHGPAIVELLQMVRLTQKNRSFEAKKVIDSRCGELIDALSPVTVGTGDTEDGDKQGSKSKPVEESVQHH